MPLLHKLCAKSARTPTEHDDLVDAAVISLCKAARAFKPEMGWTFQALATRAITNAIIDALRKRRPEVEFKEAHLESAIDRPLRAAPAAPELDSEPAPPAPPCPRAAALQVLREGGPLHAAREEAERLTGRRPARSTVQGWARAAGVRLQRGRPAKLDPRQVARWLTDRRALPGIWESGRRANIAKLAQGAEVDPSTVRRSCKKAGGIRRLRRAVSA